MKYILTAVFTVLSINTIFCQRTIDKTLAKLNNKSIPYITPDELQTLDNYILLDSRKVNEFNISHIKNATWVGYKEFDLNLIPNTLKDTPIVVYCSIGVRSEDIGEKLVASGYTNVKNLYGGIFLWLEKGYPIYDINEKETKKVHAFSKYWGKLLTKGEKIYN
ncbi:rhodanese-like domain-containing protein [Cellulophaga sp. HaHaR_3_176]|uniref:rhodanese-like domain-containing protein n=1 Tax=Cellulophaga sp. HaHaR_3_176 TaxID=1942464 RepID=UPI001C1FC77C|nr:rhodanese-like domain-containing protein [Cellulophaga sp. HaHaR_3_176]QWX83164.1 rhodanese-like domain-containing protein [Cellulophaga sp. HaHaR_3_176]